MKIVRLAGSAVFVVISVMFSVRLMNGGPRYKVLPAVTQGNLMLFPVVADVSFDNVNFLSLDEGIRSGEVVVTEADQLRGLVRPRPLNDGVWREGPLPNREVYPHGGARVNELALTNASDRPLLLLAGEIVTGGKQDRVLGKDLIIPAHSNPVALGVFCVEPHRWIENSMQFGSLLSSMAQPSVRLKAMAEGNQQAVWSEVAKSRASFAAQLAPSQARAIEATSSYAGAMQSAGVQRRLDSIVVPMQESFEKAGKQLLAQRAVGAVVALDHELIWVDTFSSPTLLAKYWPKLIRSYAAEALAPHLMPTIQRLPPSVDQAQYFLEQLNGKHEQSDTEPGVYRYTEVNGGDFYAFILSSLLPSTGFNVHTAKMKR